jgi:hypothetical protein
LFPAGAANEEHDGLFPRDPVAAEDDMFRKDFVEDGM